MKETLTAKLSRINNPKDFEILVDNLIKNDIKPLVDNARNWENMDDVIKTISPAYTGKAKPNAVLEKIKTQVKSKRKRQEKPKK
jgi:TnpA family transposase